VACGSCVGFEPFDITEIKGADSLYEADGIIAQSEKNATDIFGTKSTFYSAEGSSLCIRAMLFLAMRYAKRNGKNPLILAGRNAHKTFITASALIDFETEWLPASGNTGYLTAETDLVRAEKMIAEKEAIFMWMFSGLQRLIANNYKFTISERAERNIKLLKE
jgi:arginine/lysine/ornithine decarboxylase